MVIVKFYIVEAHFVQSAASKLVTQQSRIALYESVELFGLDKVRSNALNLLGRAAVQSGKSNRAANVRIDFFDILGADIGQTI